MLSVVGHFGDARYVLCFSTNSKFSPFEAKPLPEPNRATLKYTECLSTLTVDCFMTIFRFGCKALLSAGWYLVVSGGFNDSYLCLAGPGTFYKNFS